MAVKTEMADISLLLRVRTRRKSPFLFLCPDQSTNLSYSSTVEVVFLMKLIYQPVNFKYMFESKNIAIFKFVVDTKHRSAAMTLPNRRASVGIK